MSTKEMQLSVATASERNRQSMCLTVQANSKPLTKAAAASLPIDVLEKTFTFLEPHDLMSASHVCKNWRMATSQPVRDACRRAGVPDVSVDTSWELLARLQRVERVWNSSFLSEPPTYKILTERKTSKVWNFSGRSIQVTTSGMLVRGEKLMAIDLPAIGSNSMPKFEVMPTVGLEEGEEPGCCLVGESGAFILYAKTVRFFQNRIGMEASATLTPPEWTSCVATSENILLTGHRDGVRIWDLPTLEERGHLVTSDNIENVDIFDDGSLFAAYGSSGLAYVCDLNPFQCIYVEPCTDFMLDRRRHRFILSVTSMFPGPPNAHLRIIDIKKDAVTERKIRHYAVVAFNERGNCCLTGDDEARMQIASADGQGSVRSMKAKFASSHDAIDGLAVSRDGRWVTILMGTGNVYLWDTESSIKPRGVLASELSHRSWLRQSQELSTNEVH